MQMRLSTGQDDMARPKELGFFQQARQRFERKIRPLSRVAAQAVDSIQVTVQDGEKDNPVEHGEIVPYPLTGAR
jgi:hypothetical protein